MANYDHIKRAHTAASIAQGISDGSLSRALAAERIPSSGDAKLDRIISELRAAAVAVLRGEP